MTTIKSNWLQKFQNLKNNPQTLKFLILLNFIWGAIGIYADWPWLNMVPVQLLPFTPICSIYPPLLCIWFILYFYKKQIPGWFTMFIFIGTVTYGIMAQVYFPLYQSWIGLNFHDTGSMFWVAVYGLQSLIIMTELKKVKLYQLALIIAYFGFKDFSDYYYKTFVDFLRPDYPVWIINTMLVGTVSLQVISLLFARLNPSRLKSV